MLYTVPRKSHCSVRRFLFLLALLYLLLPAFAALPGHAADHEAAISLANGDWPPYFSQTLDYGGVGTRICTNAFGLENVHVEYDFLPWKRGLLSAQEGRVSGALGWRKTLEREKHFLFSDPLFSEDLVYFHKKDTPFNWDTSDDVGKLKIGGTLGYAYAPFLAEAAGKHGGVYEEVRTDELNFRKLIAGRIDIFPCSKNVGMYLLKTKYSPEERATITFHPKPLLSGNLYLLISKKVRNGPDLIEKFNRGLKKLHESGEYERYWREAGQ